MKISSVVLCIGTVLAVRQGGDALPQAYGIDGLLGKYLPAILGIIVALVNESENIPEWIKKVINSIGKSKGADLDIGGDALSIYHDMLKLLEKLKASNADEKQVADLRLAILAQHEKVVGYGPDED